MGFEFESIKHINLAQKLGVGNYPTKRAAEEASVNKFVFKRPDIKKVLGRTFTVWPTTSCSGCIFSLNRAKEMIAKGKNPKLIFEFIKMAYFKKINILMGTVEDFNFDEMISLKNLFVIGDCAKPFYEQKKPKRFLPGCPPKPEDIIKFLTSKAAK